MNIMDRLPHRYPFVMVDRILEVEPGVRVRGVKNVSFNEAPMQGHFPGKPIMPGVLIIEAIAQLGAFVLPETGSGGAGMIAAIDGIKFMRPVTPGDRLETVFELIQAKGPFVKGKGSASVDGVAVASIASLTLYVS